MPIGFPQTQVFGTIKTPITDYVLNINDTSGTILMNVSIANTVTVPVDQFPLNASINIVQYGAGSTSLVAGGGVTIHYLSTLILVGQYALVSITQIGTNEWIAIGALQ